MAKWPAAEAASQTWDETQHRVIRAVAGAAGNAAAGAKAQLETAVKQLVDDIVALQTFEDAATASCTAPASAAAIPQAAAHSTTACSWS